MKCPKCNGENVTVQVVTETETKHRGLFKWILWILLSIVTLGLIIIIPLITNSKTKSKTHTQAICQDCGHSWIVK